VDAAVWLTAVEAAQKSPQVVLVSNNHTDFADDENKARPHSTLAKDLEDEGISPTRVEIAARVNILEARCTVVHPMVKNRFVVEVGDTQSLKTCITRLRNIKSVFDAYRVTPTG
jgi:hypothetical protein